MTKIEFNDDSNSFLSILPVLGLLIFLYITSRYNYLIFHTLAEFFSIFVAWSLFIIVWNTRKNINNDALIFLGIAYLFIGGFDLAHTLSYKGMGILEPERGANPATQLWIVGRYMESISLCLFPLLFNKRLNFTLVFWVYSIFSVIAYLSIFFWGIFPVCFVDGLGLTAFKKSSEYIICLFLATALLLLYQKRNEFDKTVYKLLFMSIGMTIIGELAFTFYVSVYGLSNLIGHLIKIVSFYLIYKAIAYTGLKNSQDLMFKELSDKEQRYRQMFETNQAVKLVINPENGAIVEANDAACNFYGYSKKEILSLSIFDINVLTPDQVVEEMNQARSENKLVFNFPHRLASGEIREVEVYSGPIQFGENAFLYSIIQDITKRKQAEQKIKSHADNLDTILNSAPNILALVNGEGKVEMINDRGAAFGGKEKEALLGHLGGEIFNCLNSFDGKGCWQNPNCSECPVRVRILSTFNTEKSHIEEEGQMTLLIDGTKRSLDFLISTSLLNLNGSKKVLLSLADITERKRFEKSLVESQNRLSEMFEHMSSGAVVYEPTKNAEDFIFKAFNTAAEEITRIQRKDALGKRLLEVFPMMDQTGLLGTLQEVWESGEEVHLEPFYYKDDVREGWRENRIYKLPSGEVVALFDDVTLRMESESKIRQSEKKYRTLFHKSNDGIMVHNLSGQILDTNSKMRMMLGYKIDEFNQLNVQDLHPHSDMEISRKAFEETNRKGHTRFETKFSRRDGSTIDVEISSSIIDQDTGTVQGIVRDLTDRKEMEKRVLQAQKMESIGILAGGIAHDFNNILFPILGHTEMLLQDIPEKNATHDSLKQIYSGAIRARELVKQILTFSRQDNSELRLMKMQPIIKEALKLIRSTIPTSIEIKENIDPKCGVIKADPTQIHQIVMNLATNAYHAMEKDGGVLKVSLKEIQLSKTDLITPDMVPGTYACLIIADTGVGMEKDLIGKIFDPFFTTKGIGKGTGMGLSVVHGIVEGLGGVVQVYSEPGKETQFYVYFPIGKSSFIKDSIQTHEAIQGGIGNILLVDDEDAIITMEKLMLERLGYQVTSRTSSIEALDVFRDSPDKFNLVITDMAMPKMLGDQLAVELIKIRPDIPILLCTGFSETMSEEKAASLGIKGFLFKPIMMKDLSQKIHDVLDKN